MRYAVKGSNTADVTGCSGANLVGLMGKNITTGRVFWLTKVWYPPHGTTGKVILFDATVGAAATAALAMTTTAAKPIIFMLSATQGVVAAATVGGAAQPNVGALGGHMDFAAPGLKFQTGVCIAFNTSGSATIGSCGGEGYEE